jgi:hypothetical protein
MPSLKLVAVNFGAERIIVYPKLFRGVMLFRDITMARMVTVLTKIRPAPR